MSGVFAHSQSWRLPFAGLALVLLVAWAYWPGLTGPFLFDDFGNLDVLGAYGRIRDWPTFLYYLTSGNADPTGRPVALLSFLLDARDWPANAWAFKRTNLLLHLLNGGLLAWVIARLQVGLCRRDPTFVVSRWTPLLAAALWAAHPFFVSTTLYVVQREAMLPMTFALLALLAWDRAVLAFDASRTTHGWCWVIMGVGTATLLAGLSKANGFLAPTLAGLVYLLCLRPTQDSTGDRRQTDLAAWLCLGLPTLAILSYLAYTAWLLWPLSELYGRDWTLPQRLLSEPRALWSYLGQWLLPRAGGGGVYVEGFSPSRGWLAPWTTLPAMLGLLACTIWAIVFRRRFPALCSAVLFFLVAHMLESTTIPLELYFEHRNYLPMALFGWPVAHFLLRPGPYPRYRGAAASLLLATLLLLTHARAITWGNPALLGMVSADYEQDSARAQVSAAAEEIRTGQIRAGLGRLHQAQLTAPEDIDVAISAVGLECQTTGRLGADTMRRALRTLSSARRWNYGLYQWFQDASRNPTAVDCIGMGLTGLEQLVAAAESNPQSAASLRKRGFWHVRGLIALAHNDPNQALRWFNAVLALEPDADYALVQAAALGNAGSPRLGIVHLNEFRRLERQQSASRIRDMASLHRWLLQHYGYYENELIQLRQKLEADASASQLAEPA
ncbi:tetratricopeptide repeat protein [Pseudoxanthomonas helianthi]|uniref:Tetratricopeptide repeat protein n=1 Tax=Pseudoxanthomonas helianthi TaxID=1453541 RepID=A0A941AU54_9GAMM|nr:tetratricopeptide repeat protein [Pseudoxanthomonas helianthi]MBP3984525.1 tetratricopeptide repeat protein [Pseudoxanthomonas helianthi]